MWAYTTLARQRTRRWLATNRLSRDAHPWPKQYREIWSWAGGLIWFCHDRRQLPDDDKDRCGSERPRLWVDRIPHDGAVTIWQKPSYGGGRSGCVFQCNFLVGDDLMSGASMSGAHPRFTEELRRDSAVDPSDPVN